MNQVLSSCQWVVNQATEVKINHQYLKDLANKIYHNQIPIIKDWAHDLNFQLSPLDTIQAILILHSLNFCFWSTNKNKWSVKYKNRHQGGSFGMMLAIQKDINYSHRLLDPEFLSHISRKELDKILNYNHDLLLMNERLQILHEIGSTLKNKFQGQFYNAVKQSNQNALTLLKIITTNFPSFNDISTYHNKKIYFHKRAQLIISDLWSNASRLKLGKFKNINHITALADYRLPQLLRKRKILEYSKELSHKIDYHIELPARSKQETEIRASTIIAIEKISQQVSQLGKQTSPLEINNTLWLYSKQHRNTQPHHKTRTIYY